MERALTLVATGTLKISMVQGAGARSKITSLPRTLNLSTGKESTRQTGFSDTAWGRESRGYTKSARSLSKARFDAIIKDARVYVRPNRAHKAVEAKDVINIDDDDDIRGCLVDRGGDSGSDKECKSSSLSHFFLNLTYIIRIYVSIVDACT